MHRINHHLHQLPNFLQSEITSRIGNTHGFSTAQHVARYKTVTQQLIASKQAGLKPALVDNAKLLFGGTKSTKAEMEMRMSLLNMPGAFKLTDFYSMSAATDFTLQGIRFLTSFANSLSSLQSQMEEEGRRQAQRQREEAARKLTQRKAEEAAQKLAQHRAAEAQKLAQLKAEEAERKLAKQKAEEAARQQATRQAEAAAQQLVQLKAEKDLLLKVRPRVEQAAVQTFMKQAREDAAREVARLEGNNKSVPRSSAHSIAFIPGPLANIEMDKAANDLQTSLRAALKGFVKATDAITDIRPIEAFGAMLHVLKAKGVDLRHIDIN